MSPVYDFATADGPLLISLPHDGRLVPDPLQQRLSPAGSRLADTDWHVRQLYGFAADIGAARIAANYSRYVIDLNRPADGQALYPGRDETGLCPISTFDRRPIYHRGEEPPAAEIADRVRTYWQPYHDRLAAELAARRDRHGHALLWEGHTIRSSVPRFFAGRLPDFNFGTDGGRTCPDRITHELAQMVTEAGYTAAVNGRFKGGYITRHYADPGNGIFTLQLELSQITYMDEDSFEYDPARGTAVSALIRQLVERYRLRIEQDASP